MHFLSAYNKKDKTNKISANEYHTDVSLSVSIATYSDMGSRTENEDYCDYAVDDDHNVCIALADGLGGEGGGSVASTMAAQTILECFKAGAAEDTQAISGWFEEANRRVLSVQTESVEMKTTLVTLQIAHDTAMWAHIGDSRLCIFTDGVYSGRTFDHSVSQMAVLRGEISEEDIRGHVDRNRLLRAIGRDESVTAELSDPVNLIDGHAHGFLLCTDGFWEYVLEKEMESTLKRSHDAGEWLDRMVSVVRKRAKKDHDNNTAVAVIVHKKTGGNDDE